MSHHHDASAQKACAMGGYVNSCFIPIQLLQVFRGWRELYNKDCHECGCSGWDIQYVQRNAKYRQNLTRRDYLEVIDMNDIKIYLKK
jgi:hypothetical protein